MSYDLQTLVFLGEKWMKYGVGHKPFIIILGACDAPSCVRNTPSSCVQPTLMACIIIFISCY